MGADTRVKLLTILGSVSITSASGQSFPFFKPRNSIVVKVSLNISSQILMVNGVSVNLEVIRFSIGNLILFKNFILIVNGYKNNHSIINGINISIQFHENTNSINLTL